MYSQLLSLFDLVALGTEDINLYDYICPVIRSSDSSEVTVQAVTVTDQSVK